MHRARRGLAHGHAGHPGEALHVLGVEPLGGQQRAGDGGADQLGVLALSLADRVGLGAVQLSGLGGQPLRQRLRVLGQHPVPGEGLVEAHVQREDPVLRGGLVGAGALQLVRPVRGERHQLHPRMVGFHHGRQQVAHRGPGRGHDDGRPARGQGQSQRGEGGGALVDPHVQAQPPGTFGLGQRVHQRCGAGSGGDDRLPHAAVHQSLHHGLGHLLGVQGGHRRAHVRTPRVRGLRGVRGGVRIKRAGAAGVHVPHPTEGV